MQTNFTPTAAVAKLPLPAGKITIRHRQMRGVFQCFAGRTYINGASGDNAEEAAIQLQNQYEVADGTKATIHGCSEVVSVVFPFPG
jgi:hypothetical protein